MTSNVKFSLIFGALITILIVLILGLGDVLTPLLIAFFLAYLLFPLIQKLEGKGVKRNFAVTIVFLIFSIFIVLVSLLVIPGLLLDAQIFFKELPASLAKALNKVEQMATMLGVEVDFSRQGVEAFLLKQSSHLSLSMVTSFTKGLQGAFSNVLSWILGVLNFFLIPLFFFYVINDYEKITAELKSFIPNSIRDKLVLYIGHCNTVLKGYIRGQLIVALILGILYGVGLTIVGLRFGFFIGLLSGFASIIPYAGVALGLTSALTICLANYTGPTTLIGLVIVFAIVQILEGFLITPKFVGNKVGLSAFATMLSLIIGGNLLGLSGMLIAIPIAAILKTIISHLKLEYQNSEFYKS